MDGGRNYVPTGLRGSTPGRPKCAHVPQGKWTTRRGHAASDLCRPCAPPSPGCMASAVGTLGAEDRYVGRHGGRLPHEEVTRPGWVARGGGMGVRDGGMAAGRLRRRRARAAEAVAGRRAAWSPPLGVLPYLETGGALRGEAGAELRHCQGRRFLYRAGLASAAR